MDKDTTQEEAELRIIEKAIEKDLYIQQLKEKHGFAGTEAPSLKLKNIRKKQKELKDARKQPKNN